MNQDSELPKTPLEEERLLDKRWVNPYIIKARELTEDELLINDPKCEAGLGGRLASVLAEQRFPYRLLELGAGSGGHLIEQAQKNPETLCLGVELRYKRVVRTIEKARLAGVSNLFVCRVDANRLLELLPADSFDCLYVNFPDPWSKKRWHKHRMVSDVSLDQLIKVLKPGAFFSFKSDELSYFVQVAELVKGCQQFELEQYTEDLYRSVYTDGNISSEFEKLFKSKGLPIGYLKAKKREG